MKPLIILLAVFTLSLFVIKMGNGNFDLSLSGRIGMSVMLLFTAGAHFAYGKGMAMMLPDFIPYKTATIYFTGVIEIAAAFGLLISSLSVLAGWLLIVFFILILPANIYAAIRQVDFEKGTFEGKGLSYLWFRVPLQILFIVWTYLAAIKY